MALRCVRQFDDMSLVHYKHKHNVRTLCDILIVAGSINEYKRYRYTDDAPTCLTCIATAEGWGVPVDFGDLLA